MNRITGRQAARTPARALTREINVLLVLEQKDAESDVLDDFLPCVVRKILV